MKKKFNPRHGVDYKGKKGERDWPRPGICKRRHQSSPVQNKGEGPTKNLEISD